MPFLHALRLLVEPVPAEKRRRLDELWARLPPAERRGLQVFGRQMTGCGATVGAMPRCDFDCGGCYLGADANQSGRASRAELSSQLRALRRHLGPKSNLQLTDGELTLLPEKELVALVAEARALGALPMLMTHGEALRRRDGLLERLIEAGLTEISIHVDALQKGRRDHFRRARRESELEELRDEFAERIRAARRATGVRLRAATTLTVTRSNLGEIAAVLRGALARRDAIGLVSMQPLAQVGRTRDELTGVGRDELWREVAAALSPYGFERAAGSGLRFGHSQCTRAELMLVLERCGETPRIVQLVRPGRSADEALVESYFEHGFGGLVFRDDPPLERLCRGLGAFARSPAFWLREVAGWLGDRSAELGNSLAGLALDLGRGRLRADGFVVTSHHFMSRAELATERGRERLAACIFRAPVGGRMVPMCELNASGLRDAYYAALGAPDGDAEGAGPPAGETPTAARRRAAPSAPAARRARTAAAAS